jgi:hypothetical protein
LIEAAKAIGVAEALCLVPEEYVDSFLIFDF